MLLIVINVLTVMLETVDSIYAAYAGEFFVFEAISVAVFSTEYLGRLWTATEHPDYSHPVWGRLRFAVSPYMIIDMLAIAPFFVGAIVDLRFLRALRLFRFLRLLKLARYSESLQLFIRAIQMKREQLVITSIVGTILLFVSSSLMYFAERSAQPEEFSSISAALYWGVITLTTVGYGDVTPVTPIGKALGMIVAITGIGVFALPASIMASGFIEAAKEQTTRCPHCKREILEEDLEVVDE
jgi:voltage-gated potassium channel